MAIRKENIKGKDWQTYRAGLVTIGGSDASCILGLNPYKSAYALWCEKTGKIIPEDISDKEAVRLGNDLEQYVAERWMEATGKKLRRDNSTIYNDEYPFAHANIDRAVVGEKDAGFEAKTTSSWEILSKCRSGEFPESWYCQVMHYMMVTGASKWYLGVLCLGHGFFEFTIQRNEAEIKALADAECGFWKNVQCLTPPAVDGSISTREAIKTIFAESNGTSTDLTAVRAHLQVYHQLGKKISELEDLQGQELAKVMAFMGEAERGSCDGFSVTWKTSKRKTFDRKAYEAANGPIDPRFFKESETRPFRLTVKKEGC